MKCGTPVLEAHVFLCGMEMGTPHLLGLLFQRPASVSDGSQIVHPPMKQNNTVIPQRSPSIPVTARLGVELSTDCPRECLIRRNDLSVNPVICYYKVSGCIIAIIYK